MWRALLASAWIAVAAPASAQDLSGPSSPVLILDQERLFEGSRAVARVTAELEERTAELTAENRRIEAELTEEELSLTEQRATLTPEAFRDLADAFDVKVQAIRAEQDAKARDLQRLQDEGRQAFLRRITPILAEIAAERGGVVVLDRRAVILSADSIDITDIAIARINEELDEDAPVLELPEQDPAPSPDSE